MSFLLKNDKSSGEYSKKYGQGSVFTTDPCPNLVKYLLDVLKEKIKVLDILNTNKKCVIKINICRTKSSGDIDKHPFSWEKNWSPSLFIWIASYQYLFYFLSFNIGPFIKFLTIDNTNKPAEFKQTFY